MRLDFSIKYHKSPQITTPSLFLLMEVISDYLFGSVDHIANARANIEIIRNCRFQVSYYPSLSLSFLLSPNLGNVKLRNN